MILVVTVGDAPNEIQPFAHPLSCLAGIRHAGGLLLYEALQAILAGELSLLGVDAAGKVSVRTVALSVLARIRDASAIVVPETGLAVGALVASTSDRQAVTVAGLKATVVTAEARILFCEKEERKKMTKRKTV